MKSMGIRVALVAAAVFVITAPSQPCSWASGYFYQVTHLRGRVVGAKLGPLQYWSWLRQRSARKGVKLQLCSYRWPITGDESLPLVKAVTADDNGRFDFGDLTQGHYRLFIDDTAWHTSDFFDVEIAHLPRETESVKIDVSPNFPDCKGGHEFIIREVANGSQK